ncbi:MAG: D-alanyl-D-alanine carboxypeptidase family protein [Solirubrobacteraceae bacterium]
MSRRLAAIASLLAALGTAGCGGLSGDGSQRASAAGPRPVAVPLQTANGPVAGVPGRRPLELTVPPTGAPIRLRFKHSPRAGLLFDLDTGHVLWEREATRALPIASVTKMMTALLVVEHESPHARVLITRQALHYQGSGVGVLPRGKRVQLETMLYGLMLPSGNDAAIALAQRVSDTVPAFVRLMNQKAAELGLTCTRFSSPSGFVDRGNRSCAADLASLAKAVLAEPRLARIVRKRSAIRPMAIKGGKVYLYNHNPLLQMGYPGTLGIKTGFTDAAGRCLVAAVRRKGRRLGVVLLHSPDPGRQATQLLNRGFRVLP